jgi:hypothetical protein
VAAAAEDPSVAAATAEDPSVAAAAEDPSVAAAAQSSSGRFRRAARRCPASLASLQRQFEGPGSAMQYCS